MALEGRGGKGRGGGVNNEVLKETDSVRKKTHPPPNLPLEGGGAMKGAPLWGRS